MITAQGEALIPDAYTRWFRLYVRLFQPCRLAYLYGAVVPDEGRSALTSPETVADTVTLSRVVLGALGAENVFVDISVTILMAPARLQRSRSTQNASGNHNIQESGQIVRVPGEGLNKKCIFAQRVLDHTCLAAAATTTTTTMTTATIAIATSAVHLAAVGADFDVSGLLVVAVVSGARRVRAIQPVKAVVARAVPVAAVAVERTVGGAIRHSQHPAEQALRSGEPVRDFRMI